MRNKILKDIEEIDNEGETKIKTGHLYLHFDDTDEFPPPFIFLPEFALMHTLVLSSASSL